MTNKVKCPNCGKLIEITEALKSQIKEEVIINIDKKHKLEMEEIIRKTEEKVIKELSDKKAFEVADLKRELEEKVKKINEFREQELKLREEKRKLEDSKKDLELEVNRKIDEQRKNIEETITRQEGEKHRLKEMEKEKIISDLKKSLEEANRKAQQGSQQLQGEVLELDLEETLRSAFPNDTIEPVGKGVNGADIKHIVKSPKGFNCGTILWETKRTKAWTDGWITKLKDDLRVEKANIAVIISNVLPKEITNGLGMKEGICLANYNLILALAILLRKNLLEVGYQKAISSHKERKADYLYEFITSHEFKQQIEELVETYQEMQKQIISERTSFERTWKLREAQITRMLSVTANVVGSIQGKVGQDSLQIRGMELLESGGSD